MNTLEQAIIETVEFSEDSYQLAMISEIDNYQKAIATIIQSMVTQWYLNINQNIISSKEYLK